MSRCLLIVCRRCACFALLLTVLGLSGCQRDSRPAGMPELHPVSLKVLQDGVPVSGASIRLVPQSSANTWYSGGHTDESGVAIVHTERLYAGAPAGSYSVTISKIETPGSGPVEMMSLDAAPANSDATYDLVSPEFSNPTQTPLQIEVTAGNNTQQFDLGPAVRIERRGPPSP